MRTISLPKGHPECSSGPAPNFTSTPPVPLPPIPDYRTTGPPQDNLNEDGVGVLDFGVSPAGLKARNPWSQDMDRPPHLRLLNPAADPKRSHPSGTFRQWTNSIGARSNS